MPAVTTTCTKCGTQYAWNSDSGAMPDCPNCGHNPKSEYRSADVSQLISMLRSSDRYRRNHAAVELGKRRDLAAIDALVSALDDAELTVVGAAAIALGKLGDQRAVSPLVRVMKRGAQYGPSGSAAESLVHIGTPEAIQKVFANLASLDWMSVNEVVSQLAHRGGEDSLAGLIEALRSDAASVRGHAAQALGEIGDTRALEGLVPLMDDPNERVRLCAAEACSELGWTPVDPEEKLFFLLRQERWNDLRELEPDTTKRLVNVIMGDGPEDLRELASTALRGRNWEPATDEEVLAYLNAGGDAETVARKGTALIQPLVAALRAGKEDVRDTAARALTIIADAGGLAAVIESEVDTHVRCRAVEKYGELYEGESTLEPLTNALKDKEPSVRESSVKSLGTIRAQDAKALLKAMVRDADEYNSVREAAADALRQIAGRRPKVRKKGAKGPARMGFGCGGCLVVFLAALLVFALLGMLVAKKEEPNRSAIAQAKEDSRVVAVLGKPVTDRLWVAMGTEREGLHSGAKSYRVALSGPKGGAILKLIIMDGEDGRELLSAVVTPTSTGKEIHLVGTPEAQGQGAVDKQERTK